jgi:hypothetical protein
MEHDSVVSLVFLNPCRTKYFKFSLSVITRVGTSELLDEDEGFLFLKKVKVINQRFLSHHMVQLESNIVSARN